MLFMVTFLAHPKYKLGYLACGSAVFKVQKAGCSIRSAVKVLLELLLVPFFKYDVSLLMAEKRTNKCLCPTSWHVVFSSKCNHPKTIC